MFEWQVDIVTYMTKRNCCEKITHLVKKTGGGETLQRLSQRKNYAISLQVTARILVYLWNEEEQESLGEMAEDCHHSKRHTREVAEGVTGEDLKQPPGIATFLSFSNGNYKGGL